MVKKKESPTGIKKKVNKSPIDIKSKGNEVSIDTKKKVNKSPIGIKSKGNDVSIDTKKEVNESPIDIKSKGNESPIGIKVISTYYIILSVLTVIFGLITVFAPSMILNYVLTSAPELSELDPAVAHSAIVITGAVFLVIGVIGIVLGVGLFKMKSWARWILIFLALLGIFTEITWLISGQWSSVVGLLINCIIFWYLTFSNSAKKCFASKN